MMLEIAMLGPCRNSKCAPAATEAIPAFFPVTSACAGIPRRRVVVEIVDVDSSEFHNIQQVRFSKLLNLKIRQEGAHLRPRQFTGKGKIGLFPTYSVSADGTILLKLVELFGIRRFSQPHYYLQHDRELPKQELKP
jgi:hypothetical protein